MNTVSKISTNKIRYLGRKNLYGTTCLTCGCKSWINYWKNGTGSIRTFCVVVGCTHDEFVGAHVISADKRMNRQWWISPFFSVHNNFRNEMEMNLNKNVTLIPENKRIKYGTNGW